MRLSLAAALALGGSRFATAADCAGLTASAVLASAEVNLVLANAQIQSATVSAHGEWKAAPGSDTALLEIRIDADRYASRTLVGAGGAWTFEGTLTRNLVGFCGDHVFEAYVYPAYRVGSEVRHCIEKAAKTKQALLVDCSPRAVIDGCELACASPGSDGTSTCSGTCAGSVSAGMAPYQPFWNDGKSWIKGEVGAGPWTQPIDCVAGSTLSFRVKDSGGVGHVSAAATRTCAPP